MLFVFFLELFQLASGIPPINERGCLQRYEVGSCFQRFAAVFKELLARVTGPDDAGHNQRAQ
jgi:hypothetical protein